MFRILDHLLSNYDVNVNKVTHPLVPQDPHHNALEILASICLPSTLKPPSRLKYCYNKANFEAINNNLHAINWKDNHCNNPLDDAVDLFYSTLKNLRYKYIPTKHVGSSKYPPWYSFALVKVLKEKHKDFTKFNKGRISL